MDEKEVTYPNGLIAKLLDLTPTRVGQLAKEGIITKMPNGRYPASAITQYVQYLRDRAFGKGGVRRGGEWHEEKTRLIQFQADEKEIIVKKMNGELVEMVVVKEALNKQNGIIKNRLLSFPSKLAPRLQACASTAEAQQVIKIAVNEVLALIQNDLIN